MADTRAIAGVDTDRNCFDVIRAACAIQVFLGHFLTHQSNAPRLTGAVYIFSGVPVFFLLSGFFIYRSAERYGAKEFYVRRFLKIYPSLWVCIFVNTAIILAVYATKPTWKEMFVYLATQLSVCQFYTGDWLRGYGVGAPNGALWTITVTVQFYLLVRILIKLLWKRSPRVWLLAISAGGYVVI